MHLPADLALAIEEEAAAFPLAELRRAAQSISERYRAEHPRTGRLSATGCAAWAAVRMPATWAGSRTVLEELRRLNPEARPRSLLDLGAGAGAGIHAACEVFESIDQVTAMEGETGLLAQGSRFAQASKNEAVRATRWLERDLRLGPPFAGHDLVLLGWVAGELEQPARELVLERAWQAAGYSLVVIEPGTPRGFDVIRETREQLRALGAQPAAPCPSAGSCAVADGQWCHFAARVERSALHRRLKGGELSYEDEKFSYLIVSREPLRRAEARIVRHPWHDPGLIRLEICNGEDWRAVDVRKREREQFRAARKARWGDEWRLH